MTHNQSVTLNHSVYVIASSDCSVTTNETPPQEEDLLRSLPSSVVSGGVAGSSGGPAPSDMTLVPHPDGSGGWSWGAERGGGGSSLNIVHKTANYTAANGDVVLVDASGGAVSITLPAATENNSVYVKKIDSSANTVTIVGTIDTGTNLVISAQYAAYAVAADGTDWWVI